MGIKPPVIVRQPDWIQKTGPGGTASRESQQVSWTSDRLDSLVLLGGREAAVEQSFGIRTRLGRGGLEVPASQC